MGCADGPAGRPAQGGGRRGRSSRRRRCQDQGRGRVGGRRRREQRRTAELSGRVDPWRRAGAVPAQAGGAAGACTCAVRRTLLNPQNEGCGAGKRLPSFALTGCRPLGSWSQTLHTRLALFRYRCPPGGPGRGVRRDGGGWRAGRWRSLGLRPCRWALAAHPAPGQLHSCTLRCI